MMLSAAGLGGCARVGGVADSGGRRGASRRKGTPEGVGHKYRVVFGFGLSPYGYDGAAPEAPLLDLSGTLYGTTAYGGAGGFQTSYGTVFSIRRRAKRASSTALLILPTAPVPRRAGESRRVLYGTTSEGGTYGEGTVFSLSASGAERVLHSFGNGYDGAEPMAGLTAVKGRLYGTTYMGGAYGEGTF